MRPPLTSGSLKMTEAEGQLWKARAEALLPIAVAAKNLYHNARWPWTIQMPVGILIDETRLETLGEALARYEALGKKEKDEAVGE